MQRLRAIAPVRAFIGRELSPRSGSIPISGPDSRGQAADAPPGAAPREVRAPRKLGLRVALTGLVLLTVMVTAVLIHLTWLYVARRNVADVVDQLNRQIVGSV